MNTDVKDKEILKILKHKAHGTVAIFECKGFYRCYGDDAYVVANSILMSDVGIQFQQIGTEQIAYHNLNVSQYTRVVRDLLLLLRYRVELYDDNKTNGYNLKAKGILGNLVDFEDIISECVELAELSTIGCARLLDDDLTSENKLILAFCNSQDMRIVIVELNDTPNFTQFEQCVVSMQPRECLLYKENLIKAPNRFKKLEMAIKRTGIQQTILDEQIDQQNLNNCKKDVKKIFQKKYADLEFSADMWYTLNSLLTHMQLLHDEQYFNAFSLMRYGAAGYMYLSNAVLQALDIFTVGSEIDGCSILPGSSASSTLHEHLNKCRSQPGKRLIREWLRRPLFSLRQIEERLDVVEALCNSPVARQSLHENLLRRIPDIGLLTRKLVQNKANLQDCYKLYQLIVLLRKIEDALRHMQDDLDDKIWASVKELIVEQIQHSRMEFQRFTILIESTLDLDYFGQSGQHRIKPEIDEELASIAAQIKELDVQAKNVLDRMGSKLNCEVKLESNTESGFFFRITLKSETAIRMISDVKVIDSSKGGGVRFHTKSLEKLNDQFKELLQSYESGQAELTKMVIKTCAGYAPALQSLAERIGILDVLTSFAVVSASSPIPYVRPKILEKDTNNKILDLRQCRHPVVENMPNMQFIPNDLVMGINAECKYFMILTGANMGGKSTYLKSAALTILLGQIGCFVPCESATFSMIDGIYTRIGAGDFQCKGISTFMAEMIDCATILEKATANSLILIDELGRGTSTYDGFGLAWAIAEDIIQRICCFSLFATHFHEISKLEDKFPEKVKNYRMETIVQNGQLTILFQVVPGVSDRSFGLNIASLVGFPQEILQDAEQILHELENGKSHSIESIG